MPFVGERPTFSGSMQAPSSAGGNLVVDEYGRLAARTDLPGQAHHLNQATAYRDVVPVRQGQSVKLQGNILMDAGAQHTRAHNSGSGILAIVQEEGWTSPSRGWIEERMRYREFKNQPDSYGGHWNKLAQSARARLSEEVRPNVESGLERLRLGHEFSESVFLDLNRIVLQASYQKRFKRVPDFYSRMFAVYVQGHLPCGWEGGIAAWPDGNLIVY